MAAKFEIGTVLKRKGPDFDNDLADFITIVKVSEEDQRPYLIRYENGNENHFEEEFMQSVFERSSEEEYLMYKMAR
jgi:hypothetical protein